MYNQCFGTNCIALDNFWRSLSNLTINVTGNKPGGNDCSAATDFWGGTDIFFQNELPYDPPSQSAWMASPTQDGYPSFLVTRNVKSFQGYGMGSYIVFIQTTATLFDDEAFQAAKTPGVQFHDLLVVYLGGSGGDKSIINGVGGPVTSANNPGIGTPVNLISYP